MDSLQSSCGRDGATVIVLPQEIEANQLKWLLQRTKVQKDTFDLKSILFNSIFLSCACFFQRHALSWQDRWLDYDNLFNIRFWGHSIIFQNRQLFLPTLLDPQDLTTKSAFFTLLTTSLMTSKQLWDFNVRIFTSVSRINVYWRRSEKKDEKL